MRMSSKAEAIGVCLAYAVSVCIVLGVLWHLIDRLLD